MFSFRSICDDSSTLAAAEELSSLDLVEKTVTEDSPPPQLRSLPALRTSFCCRSSSLIRMSLASARAALLAASRASACETRVRREHTCRLGAVTLEGAVL